MNDRRDIGRTLGHKEARRRRLARLSFEEKVEILERLRELEANRGVMRSNAARGRRDETAKPGEEGKG